MGNKNEIITMKIVGYIDKVLAYTTDIKMDAFLADSKLVEACVFNLLQIGELAYHYDENYMKNHSEIPWRKIRGLRNRLVHDYDGVNLELVWEIISSDLSDLRCRLLG
jgi:uncharacterized protein with HEPN domain